MTLNRSTRLTTSSPSSNEIRICVHIYVHQACQVRILGFGLGGLEPRIGSITLGRRTMHEAQHGNTRIELARQGRGIRITSATMGTAHW